jgi:hypothetical protein
MTADAVPSILDLCDAKSALASRMSTVGYSYSGLGDPGGRGRACQPIVHAALVRSTPSVALCDAMFAGACHKSTFGGGLVGDARAASRAWSCVTRNRGRRDAGAQSAGVGGRGLVGGASLGDATYSSKQLLYKICICV